MCKMKWGKVLAASVLSLTMLCSVMPEVSYAAIPAEEGMEERAANAIEIQEDQIQTVDIVDEGDCQIFKFVPAETKEYVFFSESKGCITNGMLKSEDGSENYYSEYEDDGYSFSVTAELTAGKTYYCMAQIDDDNGEGTGSFTCMISSIISGIILNEDNVKKFEITEYYNDTEYYRYEKNIYEVPLGGYRYRITCTDDQTIEGYLPYYKDTIYGADIDVRFKNEAEEGIADTTGDGNALIYSLAGVEAEEVPITYMDSLIASMEVLENPWTEVPLEAAFDAFYCDIGLKVQINYTNGETKTAVGNYGEWYIEEGHEWIRPGTDWKYCDEDGMPEIGQNAMVFTYLDTVLEVPVKVVDVGVESISIVRNPAKTVYYPFEYDEDLFGLTFRIAYTDGTSEQVSVTVHDRDVIIGKYRLMLTGSFQFDDDSNRTGISIRYSRQYVEYRPAFLTYASILKNAVSILPERAVSVSLNADNTYRIFRFVPLDTNEYEIKSTGKLDTCVELLDASGNQLAADDDGGGDDSNFQLKYRLEAGKTYYYLVSLYGIGDAGTFHCVLGGASLYTVTYSLNGGTNNASNPAFHYNQTIPLQNPVRSQYIFEGWYTDSAYKNKITQIPAGARQNYVLYAKWQKVKAPGKVKLTSASNSKSKKISVKYKKIKNVDGYEIAYSTNKKFKKASSITAGKTKATIGKLKKGKAYYVRVCAYNLDSAGQKIRGKWSSSKKIAIKK